jgi:hypothetical protein
MAAIHPGEALLLVVRTRGESRRETSNAETYPRSSFTTRSLPNSSASPGSVIPFSSNTVTGADGIVRSSTRSPLPGRRVRTFRPRARRPTGTDPRSVVPALVRAGVPCDAVTSNRVRLVPTATKRDEPDAASAEAVPESPIWLEGSAVSVAVPAAGFPMATACNALAADTKRCCPTRTRALAPVAPPRVVVMSTFGEEKSTSCTTISVPVSSRT